MAAQPTGRIIRRVAAGFLASFATFGLILCFGVFQDYYQNELFKGLSATNIAWIGGVQLFFLHSGSTVVSSISNKLSPRYLMFFGTIISFVSWFFSGYLNEFYQVLLLQGIVFGIGASFVYHPAFDAVAKLRDHERAHHVAIASTGASLGGVFWSLIIPLLLQQNGFLWTCRTIGLIVLALLTASSLLTDWAEANHEADVDVESDQSSEASGVEITKRRLVARVGGLFLINAGTIVPVFYFTFFGTSHTLDRQTASYLLTTFHAASLVGLLLAESLTAYSYRIYILLATSTFAGLVAFFWALAGIIPTMMVFSALWGISLGVSVTESPVALIYAGRKTRYAEPKTQGVASTQSAHLSSGRYHSIITILVSSLGLLAGGPIGGVIYDAPDGGWLATSAFVGGSALMGSAFLLVSQGEGLKWLFGGN